MSTLVDIKTGKLDSNAAILGGCYPYFTCSPETLAIDKYAFDCSAVILAGNNANGIFCVKKYDGKFNAYQRTYVITSLNEEHLDIGYLYYFIKSESSSLTSFSTGTATKFLTRKILDPLLVPLPPIIIQRQISHLLSDIDEKIELNRETNQTLEAMARTIFKDWFVDFGPTRAKMAGTKPYLAPKIWRLFPKHLDEQEKPKGWITSTIGQEVSVVGGTTPSTSIPSYWNGDLYWATPKDLSSLTSAVLLQTDRRITPLGLSQIGSGLLPVGSVLLSSRAPIGYLVVSLVPTAINQGFIGMVCDGRLANVFVWLWTKANMEKIHQKANGSTFQEISKANFRPIPVIIPTDLVLNAFEEIARPLFNKICENERETRTLTATRDLLLPKLMSGEIRVRDVQPMTKAALARAS